ncbi:hypothetical protein F3Y22_tig00111330pilonHSYRG00171 [Hibiscus syriacus]|uniref:DNA (Cytosine-5)-methyltransferase DRM1/2 n=1 Tax=Hibiscus syriacus TaxID=106335 RepID=A0A6A2YPM9_HIBSY|nr:hypothetical protein F3Y22_tig00111330pilonHSYRG00171 [Hibiscus syriacus]
MHLLNEDDFTDIDSSSDIEEILNSDSNEESKLLYLTKMGFSEAEASIAVERCGPDSSIAELTDFICADQMAKAADVLLPVEDQITQRTLPEDAIGSSYFYYENMALAPVNVWTEMSQNKVTPFEPDEVEMLLDVQELNDNQLEQLMSRFNGLDLVVGGIKRNNLTGRNKHHQDELEDFFVGAFSCNDCYDNSLFSCSNISHSFRTWNGLVDSKTGHLQLLESCNQCYPI